MALLSCCSPALHIGKPVPAATPRVSLQHLADLQALGGAAAVFASANGFAAAGAAAVSWHTPPVTAIAGTADAPAARAYFAQLLAALGCADTEARA